MDGTTGSNPTPPPPAPPARPDPPRGRHLRRLLRGLAIAGLVAAGALVILAVVFRIAAVREGLLRTALRRAEAALPGELTVRRAAWPAPGRLELDGLLWTDATDTLLALERLRLELAWGPLLRRDLLVRELSVGGLAVDLPALRERLPDASGNGNGAGRDGGGAGVPYLRAGSLPGLPSLAADAVRLGIVSLRLDPGRPAASADLDARLELRRGRPPRLELSELTGRGPDDAWRIERGALVLDPLAARLEGELAGRVGENWPLRLTFAPGRGDTFAIALARAGEPSPPAGPGIVLDGVYRRQAGRVQGLAGTAAILLPGTRALLPDRVAAGELPDLAPLGLELTGVLDLVPAPAGSLSLAVGAADWCRGGRAALTFGPGDARLDSLELRLPDLELSASGDLRDGALAARARVRIRGTAWLRHLRPDLAAPDSLAADLELTAAGPLRDPALELTLAAAARRGELVLDALDLDAATPALAGGEAELALSARARDLRLALSGAASWTDDLVLRLSPLRLTAAPPAARPPVAGAPTGAGRAGRIRIARADSTLTVENLRLEGAAGELVLDAELPRGRPGSVRLAASWPEPPLLLQRALSLAPARSDSLREAWRRDGPFLLRIAAAVSPGGAGPRVEATGRLRLPGPATLATLLPPGAPVADLGPLEGELTGAFAAGDPLPTFRGGLILERTAWLDTARAVVAGAEDDLELRELELALPGLRVAASGERRDDLWDLAGSLQLTDLAFVRRLAPQVPADLRATVAAELRLEGDAAAPRAGVTVAAALVRPGLDLPSLRLRLERDGEGLSLAAAVDSGLTAGALELDSLTVDYRSGAADGTPWPGRLDLRARGPALALAHLATLDRDGRAWELRGDSLALAWHGQGLRSRGPFDLRLDPETGDVRVADLDLAGPLGTVTATGHAGPDSADLAVRVRLTPPPRPPLPDWPEGLWPRQAALDLRATGPRELRAEARAEGLALGRRDRLVARAVLEGRRDRLELEASLADSQSAVLTARARVPLRLAADSTGSVLGDGPLEAEAVLTALPLPVELAAAGGEPRWVELDGRFRAGGTGRRPEAELQLGVRPTGWPKLYRYALTLEAGLAPAAGDETPAAATLTARATLDREGRTLLDGELAAPVLAALEPPVWRLREDLPLSLRVRSEELLLNEFDPMLPPDAGLQGTLRLSLDADGPAADPRLDGTLTVRRLQVSMADGTRVAARGEATLAGTALRPVLRGGLEIESGVIRLPDPPRNLLPAAGDPLLWQRAPEAPGPAPAPAAPVASAEAPATGGAPRVEPDVDVDLSIPSGLWLRGQGLEVELSGDLSVIQREGRPAVTGGLQAARGHLSLLGRAFQVESGQVTFYGEDELDPALDLTLRTHVAEVMIRVVFGGTLRRPELSFASEPEMTEGDIMAYLLFGRPLDDLDSEQTGLIQRRAADVAAAYGTAQLEARLSSQLGVDMVGIRESRGPEGGSALVIGKYLSRRALLKYEQALDDRTAFYLNLEYFLSRAFKLETLYGRQSQSGLELSWSREY